MSWKEQKQMEELLNLFQNFMVNSFRPISTSFWVMGFVMMVPVTASNTTALEASAEWAASPP